MELRQLRIFCAAAQMLNFTKAAVKLGYAQSNITSQVKQLEEELNVKLFERLGRGIQLTGEGKRFLENVKRILEQCERAKEEFSPGTFRGILTIGAAETLCVYRLPNLLRKYRQKYPQVEIKVQTESCQHLFDLLRSNEIDVALVLTGAITQPDIVVKSLYAEAMAVVVSPSHPLARRKEVNPKDLAGECLIITAEGCGYRPIILRALQDQNVKLGAIMALTSVGAIKECTVCGLGVAVLPAVAVQDDIDRGRLCKLEWKEPEFNVKTQLVLHQDKWLSPAIQAFLDLCGVLENKSE